MQPDGQWSPQPPQQSPYAPYASLPPSVVPARQPRGGGSSFIPWVVGLSCSFVVALGGLFVYAVYRSQTPEGKAEAAAHDRKLRDEARSALEMLAAIQAALPTDEQLAAKLECPLGTDASRAPVVDTAYLSRAVGGPATEEDAFAAVAGARSSTPFSVSLLERIDEVRNNAASLGISGASYDVEKLLEAKTIVVLDVAEFSAPRVENGSFEGGELSGQVIVVDRASRRAICHAPVSAQSSESVEYGGGVRLKVKGIPTPAMGKKSLDDAVAKDFTRNLKTAIGGSLREIGAQK
jgi:hypothetical protein